MEKELTQEPKTVSKQPVPSRPLDSRVDGEPSDIRYATDEQFRKAQRKTSKLHAGLFRRLSK